MSWLFLVALGIIWAAFLVPDSGRRSSPEGTVEDFGRGLDVLADTESERWVVTPRKGVRFIGTRARQRARIRERRRRLLVFLLEGTAVTFLIGLIPPLRAVLTLSFGFAGLTGLYVWLLIKLRHLETVGRPGVPGAREAVHVRSAHGSGGSERYAALGSGRRPRPLYNGLTAVDEGDELVHVIVRVGDAQPALS